MCFGGSKGGGQQQPAPAPAPPPPAPVAEQQSVTAPRRAEDKQLFGTDQPSLRVDRSVSSGGVGRGGTGLRM